MKRQIYIHPYTMRSRDSLNAKSKRVEHEGVLIRVEGDRGYGYGCIHPWPELGDYPLDQTLGMLCSGELVPLSQRALYCVEVDMVARSENRSLFDGLAVPRSHATLEMNEGSLSATVDAGFQIVKLKVGRDPVAETDFIREASGRFPDLVWRLDFNHVMDDRAVVKFLGALGDDVRDKIDFIEDAYPSESSPWVNALGPFDVPMAVDREVEDAFGGFGVAIIKPAINDPGPILERALDETRRCVFTSYMDHPLGQAFAAWEAARALQQFPDMVDTCGLITHGLFEANAFTEALGVPGPDFYSPAGTGLGFDHLLEDLSWKPLK